MGSARKLAAALGIALPLLAAALPGSKADSPAKLADALLKAIGTEREPGAAVIVLKDGEVIYVRSRGVADLQAMRPIDGRTSFRLASLTKAFTAAAVMLLVREGKLRYADRLTDLLRGFPDYGRDITLRHLLDHTSGLPDYEGLMPPPPPGRPVEDVQIDDAGVLELLKGRKALWFAPGRLWRYSNSGYVLLGLIVARASGRSFPTFLPERIFQPLKMTGTVAYVRGKSTVATGPSATRRREAAGVSPTRARPRRPWATAASTRPSTTSLSGTRPFAGTSSSRKRRCGPR